MKGYFKRWLKSLVLLILFCIISLIIAISVVLLNLLFNYNEYIGWIVLFIIAVTIITSFQSD